MTDLPSVEQVEVLLLELQQPQTVKAASEALRKYLGHPACVPTLFYLMCASQHIAVFIYFLSLPLSTKYYARNFIFPFTE
jgi:hypothetical protein